MDSQQRHLLVVESKQTRGRLFRKTSAAGSETVKFTTANSLAQARRYLAEFTPDLVLADINLPDGKATQLLPPKGDKPPYPLVVMTDYPDEKLAAEAVKAGAIDYIVKSDAALKNIPFLIKRVLSQWNAVIKCKQAEENLRRQVTMRKALLDNLPCIAMILRKQTREIVASNEAASQVGAVPGMTCYETCTQRRDPCPFCLAPQVWATDEPKRLEVEYRGKHYQCRWVPLTEDLYVHYIFDITEHKKNERQLLQRTQDLDKRIRELNCLFMASSVMADHDKTIDQVLREVADLIHASCMYPYKSCVRITYDGREFTACPNHQGKENCFGKTTCVQSADIIVNDEKAGSVKIYYPQKKMDDFAEKSLLSEQTYLVNTLTVELGRFIERKQTEQKLLDYQHQLKTLASKLLLLEESERRRLAMGVHDSIGQNLALARVVLRSSMESTTDTGILEALREACASLDEVVEDVHSLTFELSNPVLYEFGFVAAAQDYLTEKIRDKHGLKCKFIADTKLPELGHEISVILYRTVRELLVNVVKHAKAKAVNLCITKTGEKLQVDIEDDGVGFDPAGVDSALTEGNEGGFGLFSIRQQLEDFGGTVKIKSKLGKGTCITVAVPLKNNNTKPESERASK